MMTKTIMLIALVFICTMCNAKFICKENLKLSQPQQPKCITKDSNKHKIIGFLDHDDIIDTIYYSLDQSHGEPLFLCEVFFGNKESKTFYIATGSGNIQLSSKDKGTIVKSEIVTGNFSSEEIETYVYNTKHKNWFISTVKSNSNGKAKTTSKFEEYWSIDGESILSK